MSPPTNLRTGAELRRIQQVIIAQRHDEAREALQSILKRQKNDPKALWMLLQLEWIDEHRDRAMTLLRKYLQRNPRHVGGQCQLGTWLWKMGRYDAALDHLRKLQRKHPDEPDVIRALAMAHDSHGDAEAARALLQPSIDDGTDDAVMIADYTQYAAALKDHEGVVALLQARLAAEDVESIPAEVRRRMGITLGQSLEQLQRYDEAFDAWRRANTVDAPTFHPDLAEQYARRVINVFSPERYAGMPRTTLDTERPVFIISRPRAGSTLLERIIGAHPAAVAAGELDTMPRLVAALALRVSSTLDFPECILDMDLSDMDACAADYLADIADLQPGAARVTDKCLSNHFNVGLISCLFPRARFIDLRRAPLDNCLGCYAVNLGPAHPGSYDLAHLALEYRHSVRLMDHWHELFDAPILRLNYEDLVADQAAESRRVIDFLGLDWDDRCLEFHKPAAGAATGPTPTLSRHQVSQPIYASSVRRADHFADRLAPVREALDIPPGEHPLGHDLRF